MTKKFDYHYRKELLEARRRGLSDTELKSKYGIKDDRTLKRHLKLADQEEEARLVKVEILKDALSNHLAEIRSLLEEWENSLLRPRLGSIYLGMPPVPTQDIEANPLFKSLKEHLPFSTLWRDYSTWKSKTAAYVSGCQLLLRQIGEEAQGSVPADILREWGTQPIATALKLGEPYAHMMEKYQSRAKSDLEIASLIESLESIEAKLHESLKEIRIRHDYIMYTCRLCPGHPRL